MAPQRRTPGQPPEESDPRDLWRAYADDSELSDDHEWAGDDFDPSDGRPLPRRRRRGSRIARALAWIGGAALLMLAGGVLALVAWPRSSGQAPTVTAVGGESADTQAGGPPEAADARERASGAARTPGAVVKSDEPVTPSSTVTVSPPPLPPLPPGLEPATPAAASPPAAATPPAAAPPPAAATRPAAAPPSAASPPAAARPPTAAPPSTLPPAPSRREAAAVQGQGRDEPEAVPPQIARSEAPQPALPPRDTRTSAEIMADFLVTSGDRHQAESTARAYGDWYAPGTAERAYWLRVLAAIRARH